MNASSFPVVLRAHTWLFANLLVLCAITVSVYTIQLSDSYRYIGYQPLVVDASYVAIVLASFAALSVFLPTSIVRPSDYFGLLYGLFVVVPYVIFHRIVGQTTIATYLFSYGVILIPMVLYGVLSRIEFRLRLRPVVHEIIVERLVLIICVVGVAIAFAYRPGSAGFELETMYVRRVEARDIFVAGSALSYLTNIVSNGMLPFLAFTAGLRRRVLYFLMLFLLGLVFYYVFGKKIQIVLVVMAFAIGYGVDSWGNKALHRLIFRTIWVCFAIFLIERFFLWEVSVTGDLVFRRIFSGNAQLIAYYFDLMLGDQYSLWNPLTGAVAPEGVAFLIGDVYFHNKNLNANTNAFIHALAANGVPGFCATVFLVFTVFTFLDLSFRSRKNSAFSFLGFLYALVLTEQSAATALVSSGVGLLIALVCLAPRGWNARANNTRTAMPQEYGVLKRVYP